jgi:hypothetical protein
MDYIIQIYEYVSSLEWQNLVSIFITTIVGLFVLFFKTSFFQDIVTKNLSNFFSKLKKQNTKNQHQLKEVDVINHDVFNYIEFWLYNQIPSLNLRTQYRTAVFRKYLHVYINTYKEQLLTFVKETDYKSMEGVELRKNLLTLITDTTLKMENEMRVVGIPEVIILKMKNVLNDRINLTMDLINTICDSSFYDSYDNLLKIYSFLNIIHSILDNTISNVESVCNNLNGELSGLSIDGFTEPVSGNH